MALRLGFKINRFLHINRHKLHNFIHVKSYSSQNSKPKYRNPYIKSASTLTKNQVERKFAKHNENPISSAPISTQNNLKGIKSAEILVIPSDLNKSQVTIQRKFAKSSTQNAITRPLKLSRLANPFPEPVKTLPSATVSDDEKAWLMYEQVKMEARFNLQMHQEMLLKHKKQPLSQSQNVQVNKDDEESVPFEQCMNYPFQQNSFHEGNPEPNYPFQQQHQQQNYQQGSYQQQPNYSFEQPFQQNSFHEENSQPNHSFQQQPQQQDDYQQGSYQQQPNYPFEQPQHNIEMSSRKLNQQLNYRKPKNYKNLVQDNEKNIHPQQIQQQQQPQQKIEAAKKDAMNTTENTAEEVENRRPPSSQCRKRRHTRAARYLRHSWYPRHIRKKISRQYSTISSAINPEIISDSEKCDRMVKHLRTLSPEYKNLTKPLFIPGSNEEKEFMKSMLKLIAKHNSENQLKKQPAPFPSYSEIQTYTYDSKKDNKQKEISNMYNTPGRNSRFYSTTETKSNEVLSQLKQPVYKIIPKFSYTGTPISFNIIRKPGMKKQQAPYPAYSEIFQNPLDDVAAASKSNSNVVLFKSKHENKYYSTSTTTSDIEKQAKKKKPCKNPFPPVPECDYAETARKKAEKKRKKHCPKKDKKCKSVSDEVDNDNSMIISKVKAWLSSYKPNADNIKVTRSSIDVDGRETYVIEVNEFQEITPEEKKLLENSEAQTVPEIVEIIQPLDSPSVFPTSNKKIPFRNVKYHPIEFSETHAPEMTDPLPVLTRNIPEFVSSVKIVKPLVKPVEIKSKEIQDTYLTAAKEVKVEDKFLEVNKLKNYYFDKSKDAAKEVKVEDKFIEVNKLKNYFDKSKDAAKAVKVEDKSNETNKLKNYFDKSKDEKMEEKSNNHNIYKVRQFIAAKPTEVNKTNENTKIKNFTIAKHKYEKSEIKTKEDRVNKLSELFCHKQREHKIINKVKDNFHNKTKMIPPNEVNQIKEEIKQNKNKYKLKSTAYNYIESPSKTQKAFADLKDLNDFSSISLPEPCPVFTNKLGSSKSPEGGDCNNPAIQDGCKKQKKKDDIPQKKCRFKKKRKLPSCDDVKNKKNKFMPLYNYIPGLEHKPEYAINPPKKTYFINKNNVSNFINLKAEDINMLANQMPKKDEFVPFKLKPRFWRK